MEWVWEKSRMKGISRLVLLCLAANAEKCVAITTVEGLREKTLGSRRQIFSSLRLATRFGEIEQIKLNQQHRTRERCAYHFTYKGADRKAFGSDNAKKTCPQLILFLMRYGQSAESASIPYTQMRLLDVSDERWIPAITEEELHWRNNQLRQKVGLPRVEMERRAGGLYVPV